MKKLSNYIFGLVFAMMFRSSNEGAFAQTVVLQKEVRPQKTSDNGPNLKKHTQLFFTMGMIASPDYPGARIIYGSSAEFGFGLRKKYKIGAVYSLGWSIGIEYIDFKLKQYEGKKFPSSLMYDKQRLDINFLNIGFFNRFNFDPSRGNTIGKYLEIGIRGKYAYAVSEVDKFKVASGNARLEISDLNYLNKWQSDVYAQLGNGHFAFWGSMRFTELLYPMYNYPKLPSIAAGIEVGF